MNAQAVLTSARFGDDDEIRELLQEFSSPAQQDALVNFVQEDTKNTPLHMGASVCTSNDEQLLSRHKPLDCMLTAVIYLCVVCCVILQPVRTATRTASRS